MKEKIERHKKGNCNHGRETFALTFLSVPSVLSPSFSFPNPLICYVLYITQPMAMIENLISHVQQHGVCLLDPPLVLEECCDDKSARNPFVLAFSKLSILPHVHDVRSASTMTVSL